MSLTWHIIRKDFRRLWLPLVLWLLLPALILVVTLGSASHMVMTPEAFDRMSSLAKIWLVLNWWVGLMLAAWLVMEDGLTGTQVFWRTRPISGVRLLVAKMVGAILMFSVLPVLVMTPIWLSGGFSTEEWVGAALELGLKQGIFTAFAFALGCGSRTSGQFFAVLLGVALIVPLGVGYCAGIFDGSQAYLGNGLAETRYRLVIGLFMLALVAYVGHQYLTCRPGRGLVLLGVSAVLIVGVRLGWRWDLASSFREYPTGNTAKVPEVNFYLESATVNPQLKRQPTILLSGRIAGAPSGTFVRIVAGRSWWGDDSEHQPEGRYTASTVKPPADVVGRVAGLDVPIDDASTWEVTGVEPAGVTNQSGKDQIRFQLELSATLMRGTVWSKLPLREGAEFHSGSSWTLIKSVERLDERLIVSLEERAAWPPWTARPQDSFVLVNPGTAPAVSLGEGEVRSLLLNSIMIRQRQFAITPPTREVAGQIEEIPGWQETARLVQVRFTPDRWFSRLVPVALSAKSIR